MVQPDVFQPAEYSIEELHFLLDHLEESPNVALHGKLPAGVNAAAITKALGRFSSLSELERARKQPWAGYDPIQDSIKRFIAYQEKCLRGQEQGEPRHPSAMTFDSTGAMSRSGIGSDAAEMVRTELLPDGSRKPFGVQLVGTVRKSRMWGGQKSNAAPTVDEITHHANGTLECTICHKVVAHYEVEKGTRVRNKAKADARKHCLKASKEIARHRAILNVPIP